jgi:hypothetical protein
MYLTLLLLTAYLAPSDYKTEVYNAYVNNRMDSWKEVIYKMEKLEGRPDELILELINYEYGYIGYCLTFDKTAEAKEIFSMANKNLILLEKKGYKPSDINAYKSAFYGFRITFSTLTAPVNGPKSYDYAKKAVELDQTSYLAWTIYGNAEFNMPAAFGGSKKLALEYFLRARTIMEKNKSGISNNWNYLYLLTLIAQTHDALGNSGAAREQYEEILRIEPGFVYVRDILLPEFKRKAGNKPS